MAHFSPFKALRPRKDLIAQVSAKSTDFNSQELLVDALRNNPYSFHHVTKNHLNYSGAFQEPEKFLPFAAKFIHDMIEKGVFIREEEDCYYVYEQTRGDGREFRGLIGLAKVDDYNQNLIKKHEEIRPSRVKFMVELFKTTKVLGEPTLLAYHNETPIDLSGGELIYKFSSVDKKEHRIYKISDTARIQEITKYVDDLGAIYIADGHHRSASTAQFHADYPQLKNDYCLGLLLEETELEIKSFHRLIKSVVTKSDEELLSELSEHFHVTKIDSPLLNPEQKKVFGLYTGNSWYKLEYRGDLKMMDVALLEELVVRPIYGIQDSRTDSQISFLPNTDDGTKLLELVNNGSFDVAFTSKPCEFSEIREISDRDKVLPPKSTYIEPKLRAGMIIQEF